MQNDALWHAADGNIRSLVLRLLERDPAQRASASDALRHPWINADMRVSRPVMGDVAGAGSTKRARLRKAAVQQHVEDFIKLMTAVRPDASASRVWDGKPACSGLEASRGGAAGVDGMLMFGVRVQGRADKQVLVCPHASSAPSVQTDRRAIEGCCWATDTSVLLAVTQWQRRRDATRTAAAAARRAHQHLFRQPLGRGGWRRGQQPARARQHPACWHSQQREQRCTQRRA